MFSLLKMHSNDLRVNIMLYYYVCVCRCKRHGIILKYTCFMTIKCIIVMSMVFEKF